MKDRVIAGEAIQTNSPDFGKKTNVQNEQGDKSNRWLMGDESKRSYNYLFGLETADFIDEQALKFDKSMFEKTRSPNKHDPKLDRPETEEEIKYAELIQDAFKKRPGLGMSKTEIWKERALLIWNGFNFFGFDDQQLARHKNEPRVWWKTKSIKWIIIAILILLLSLIYIINIASMRGTIKSTNIEFNISNNYTYKLSDQFHMVGFVYFNMDELIPVV